MQHPTAVVPFDSRAFVRARACARGTGTWQIARGGELAALVLPAVVS